MKLKNTNRLFIAFCIMFMSITCFAQEFKIFGNVVDAEDKRPIPRL